MRSKQTKMGLRRVLAAMLVAFIGTLSAWAQSTITIKGQVQDNVGSPMPGVAVVVEGTTTGTVTDFDGNYSIEAAPDAVLSASFLGYESDIQAINGRTTINFRLFEELTELEELMVIGYGTQKKSDLTGAISQVKSDDIVLTPSVNPMESLQGKVAGLDITKTSGAAGAGVNMQLRGTRSFSANGTPTFIIDGLPGDYESVNPNDIESIEILKDASSTAVYGASGANGVVLITTKSGKEGKMTVNLNAYAGVNGWSRYPVVRMGESYFRTIREAQNATGNQDRTDEEILNNVIGKGAWDAYSAGQSIDWAKELLRNGSIQSYSIAVAGGTEKTKSYFSLNFAKEKGEYRNDDNRVYSSSIKVDHEVRKWLSLGINTQISYTYRNVSEAKLDDALVANPIGSLYDEEGNMKTYTFEGDKTVNFLVTNHSNFRNNYQLTSLFLNPYLEVRPIEGLSWLSRAQAKISTNRYNSFRGIGCYNYYKDGATNGATNDNVKAGVIVNRAYDYKWENVLTYKFNIAEANDFTLTAVSSWSHDQSDMTSQIESNIADNAYLWHNMGQSASDKTSVKSSYSMSKALGFVGRLAYSYNSKYLASVSVRHDGSSRLAKDYRWDTFPAFSLGWRISEENFMDATEDWLTNLKVRFGWGVTGTANIAPYSSLSNIEKSSLSFSGSAVDVYKFGVNYSSPDLGWEKSYSANLGLDVNLWNSRVDLTADFYNTRTEGVIWTRSLPITDGGYDSSTQYKMAQNICETNNKGIELSIATVNVKNDDWEWKSNITFSANKEEITELIGGAANNIKNGDYALTIGEPVHSFFDYQIEGVWQKGEEDDAAVFGKKPGDYKLATNLRHTGKGEYKGTDANGNEVTYTADNKYTYSDKDYRTLGHNTPDWTLGFKNNVKWRSWDLSMFLFWRQGQMIKYDLLSKYDPTGKGNFPEYFNYWSENNASNDFAGIDGSRSLTSYTGYAARAFVDGSYFKVKNITVGYTMPKAITDRLTISNWRFYATITNPLVHAKSDLLQDYDPEQNGSYNSPLTRQLVFGMNMTF